MGNCKAQIRQVDNGFDVEFMTEHYTRYERVYGNWADVVESLAQHFAQYEWLEWLREPRGVSAPAGQDASE